MANTVCTSYQGYDKQKNRIYAVALFLLFTTLPDAAHTVTKLELLELRFSCLRGAVRLRLCVKSKNTFHQLTHIL